MDMYPDSSLVPDYDQRFTFLNQTGFQFFRVHVFALKHQFGTIPVRNFIGGDHFRETECQRDTTGDDLWFFKLHLFGFALGILQGAFQNGIQSLSAGIDNTGFFKYREQSRGVCDGFFSGTDGCFHYRNKVFGITGGFLHGGV